MDVSDNSGLLVWIQRIWAGAGGRVELPKQLDRADNYSDPVSDPYYQAPLATNPNSSMEMDLAKCHAHLAEAAAVTAQADVRASEMEVIL